MVILGGCANIATEEHGGDAVRQAAALHVPQCERSGESLEETVFHQPTPRGLLRTQGPCFSCGFHKWKIMSVMQLGLAAT